MVLCRRADQYHFGSYGRPPLVVAPRNFQYPRKECAMTHLEQPKPTNSSQFNGTAYAKGPALGKPMRRPFSPRSTKVTNALPIADDEPEKIENLDEPKRQISLNRIEVGHSWVEVITQDKGWTRVPNSVIDSAKLTMHEKLVLIAVLRRSFNGDARPNSQKQIAAQMRMTRDTVGRAQRKLIRLGFIEATGRPNDGAYWIKPTRRFWALLTQSSDRTDHANK
jgi:DNA-binding MarR family transcriptional regulator